MDTLKLLVDSVKSDCDWFGLRDYKERSQTFVSRNGQMTTGHISHDEGFMVEVMVDGQLGYSGTSDFTPQGIQRALDQATVIARLSAPHKLVHFDESIRPIEEGEYHSQVEQALETITPAEIQNRLNEVTTILKDHDAIIEAQAMAILINTNIEFMSSSGSRLSQSFQIVSRDMSATAAKDDVVQKRSLGMQGCQCGVEALDLDFLRVEAKRIREQAVELLSAPDCPTDKRDLILAPDQLYLQVHESIGHPLELDRILGDERNYAGWSFIGPQDFGSLRYGPDILNVTFDPHLPGEMASYAYDDNGVKAQKEYLIRNGLLERAIGGIESQKRSGLPGVSCARSSSWNRPPMDRMANINIEPGESSLGDMISSVEKGIIMRSNRSWSIDDYRNKFQFGCEYGELIENGEITGIVRNPNYRGETIDFWNSLSMVGDADSFEVWGTSYCGKGEPNQVIRVGHAIPYCKFTNMSIFGGAS
jgi:predicted Zn-dependent protease